MNEADQLDWKRTPKISTEELHQDIKWNLDYCKDSGYKAKAILLNKQAFEILGKPIILYGVEVKISDQSQNIDLVMTEHEHHEFNRYRRISRRM